MIPIVSPPRYPIQVPVSLHRGFTGEMIWSNDHRNGSIIMLLLLLRGGTQDNLKRFILNLNKFVFAVFALSRYNDKTIQPDCS
jgi:hypothetical protein